MYEPSLGAVVVGYKPKIDLPDERRPLCISRNQFARCFFRSAVVRACNDNATEYGRHRNSHDRQIEVDRVDQDGDENYVAAYYGDLTAEDEFAATLNPVGELIDLRLELHDLIAKVAVGRHC
jgi:hypothetical protein